MSEIFKSYKIKIEIISPVHIGSGEEYIPTDYVIADKKLYFINREKFMEKIEDSGKYEEFLSICDSGDILKIRKFIKDNFSPDISDFWVSVTDSIQKEYNNKIDKPTQFEGKERRQVINQLEIRKLIYTNYKNLPIIPGSSIKGSIRTAILNNFAKSKDFIKEKNSQKLEKYLLNYNDSTDDPFKEIKISDFEIIKGGTIIDIVKNLKKFGENPKGIPVKMEFFAPDTQLIGEIRISNNSKFTIKDIVNHCNLHYLEDVYKWEYDYFNYSASKLPEFKLDKNEFYLRIGQHSGAYAVTLFKYRNGNIRHQKLKINMNHQRTTWNALSFNMPLGWMKCKILNEDINIEMINSQKVKLKNKIISDKKSKPATDVDISKLIERFGKK